ncbi:MAG: hypothetical protein JWO38_3512 [Gemmataceae bacterium]|nr:hypothetical protein [Gemmataceae bacterium]
MMKAWVIAALFAGLLTAAGCGGTADKGGEARSNEKKDKKEVAKGEGGHDWWCDEHGVKEEECSMCNPKVAKAFQDKGDWCKEHRRAKSQCFICDPGLKDKYAAEYRAKYGKEPPEPDGQKPETKGK